MSNIYFYLQLHFNRKHNDDFQFFCDNCDKKFCLKSDYTRHLASHEKNPCTCNECGSTLPNKISLYFHTKRQHRGKKLFDCPHCTRKLRSQKNLENHMQQHGQKFICEMCGMDFPRKQALKRHIQIHSGEKLFLCHICGKVFGCMSSQQIHILTHVEQRPYICDICGKSFTQRTPMMLHRKKHPGNHPPPPPVKISTLLKSLNERVLFKKKEK